MEKTLYEILEVSENASQEVIEKAYKVLVKRYHPDLQEDANKSSAEDKIKKVNEAYEILSDEARRKEYDEELEKKREYEKQLEEDRIRQEANTTKQNYSNYKNSNNYTKEDSQEYNEPTYEEETYNQQEYNEPPRYNVYSANLSPEELYWEKQKIAFQEEYEKEYSRIVETYPDDKKQKKILKKTKRKLENKYLERYDSYLRRLGYKVKTRWTFEKVRAIIIFILSIILLGWLLWIIPPTHNMLLNIYQNNGIIKSVVDIIISIFSGIIIGIGEVLNN